MLFICSMKEWYQLDSDEVLQLLSSDISGLNTSQVDITRKNVGANILTTQKKRTRFSILLDQFKDFMIVVLILAAIISFLVGEQTDAFIIIAIILANAVMGFVQEYNAEESINLLKKMAAHQAIVRRNGSIQIIYASELVPGDIILLEAGNIVPADARLLEVHGLKTEEAALTGESDAIIKLSAPIPNDNLLPADQLNMLFKGTIVSNGSGVAIVTAIGMKTEMGKIAGLLESEPTQSPLQYKLSKFSKQLAVIVLVICSIVFLYGLYRGETVMSIFLTSLSLAVAALPEALPAVITIALARGARRMMKTNALVRKLSAVETLGSVTYICSDKTGTLTQNKMTVDKWQSTDENLLLYAMVMNNEVKVNDDGEHIGDSTEIAMVRFAESRGVSRDRALEVMPVLSVLPFDSDRMMMSTVHKIDGKHIVIVKGAPVKIAECLSEDNTEKEKWLKLNREWASNGQRILFFAYKYLDTLPEQIDETIEKELKILGVVGMIDPPRKEVAQAIEECKTAGIKIVMITGDQPATAGAIASALNIADENTEVVTGVMLNTITEEQLSDLVATTSVYARVSPEQKLKIVRALQQRNEFVAMTGDGVNDAPSLKQANIGVAMGITGTDVAKDASHMILLDDNFATIVKAVKEGRAIYENIRKFILYVLSCNLGEILTIFFAPMLGLAIPLLPIHILWINLVTDGLPGLAIASERAEHNIMKQPPRSPKENLFTRHISQQIIITGIILAIASLGIQLWADNQGYSLIVQQTLVFTVLCFAQLGNALSIRSAYQPIFKTSLLKNPLLITAVLLTVGLHIVLLYIPIVSDVFKTAALNYNMVIAVLFTALMSLVAIEIIKLLIYKLVYSKTLKVNVLQ